MPKNLKDIAIVSGSTLGSRLLGLLRDILIFASFGAGPISSAFVIAFTLPNLMRRLFGEGALASAFVPIVSSELEKKSPAEAFAFTNKVITRMALLMLIIVVVAMGVLWALVQVSPEDSDYRLGWELSAWMMPYMWFVCLAALVSALLNVLQRFFIPSLMGVWLNLTMIIALGGLGYTLGETALERVYYLTGGVVVGGIVQLAVPLLALRHEGWRYRFDLRGSPALTELFQLFLPGVLGAGIYQINIAVSRGLAWSLDDSSVSLLYVASRLVELPLGLFGIAVTTVIYPRLARLIAADNRIDAGTTFAEGLRLILGITVPASVGLALLAKPVLDVLFAWGNFGDGDVALAKPVLFAFAWALPFYALAGYLTRGFHSLKDTRSPVRIAMILLLVNGVLSVVLMRVLHTTGLALAGTLTAVVQVVLLYKILRTKEPAFCAREIVRAAVQITVASLVMALLAMGGYYGIEQLGWTDKSSAMLSVCVLIPLCIVVYFTVLWFLGFHELALLRAALRKRKEGR